MSKRGDNVLAVIAGLVGRAGLLLVLLGVIVLIILAFTFSLDALEHVTEGGWLVPWQVIVGGGWDGGVGRSEGKYV